MGAFSIRLAVQHLPLYKGNGKEQDGSRLFLYSTFWLAQIVLLLFSGPALCINVFSILISLLTVAIQYGIWFLHSGQLSSISVNSKLQYGQADVLSSSSVLSGLLHVRTFHNLTKTLHNITSQHTQYLLPNMLI